MEFVSAILAAFSMVLGANGHGDVITSATSAIHTTGAITYTQTGYSAKGHKRPPRMDKFLPAWACKRGRVSVLRVCSSRVILSNNRRAVVSFHYSPKKRSRTYLSVTVIPTH
jgi:hypothetical protein